MRHPIHILRNAVVVVLFGLTTCIALDHFLHIPIAGVIGKWLFWLLIMLGFAPLVLFLVGTLFEKRRK